MTSEVKRDILQWDVQSWYKVIQYWENCIDWTEPKKSLELGARQGGLSLWLGLKGISTVCTDLNDVKCTAQPLHDRYSLTGFIEYKDIDATNIPFENTFDLIVFKSIVGGIGKNENRDLQQKVFNEIHKALKPGGKLLFAENLAASPLHRRLRERYVDWGKTWRYVSLDEMKEFLKVFSSCQLKTTGVVGTFGRNEDQKRILALLDQTILNKVCPEGWKYISYGVAVK